MQFITNANLILEDKILPDAVLVTEGARIVDFGQQISVPAEASVIDAKGLFLAPGFVDIHVHGCMGKHTCLQPLEAAAYFLDHGTTTLLPTPSYSQDFDLFLREIQSLKAVIGTGGAAKAIGGFYMEGPYTNPEYGAKAWMNPWRIPADPAQYEVLVNEAGAFARVWVIAPERDPIVPFLAYAKKVNPKVRFSVGHSEATPDQIRKLKPYGIVLQTHSMNATGRPPVPKGTRSAGPDEYCLIDPDIYTELICDSLGIHVSRDMQQLLLHCKGVDKIVLITDSTASTSENPKAFRHVTDLNFDERGDLAGSRLTMDQACRNAVAHLGCDMVQAFLMAARNPAQAIGMDKEIGTIAKGKKANLIFVDDQFRVDTVILEGEIWKENML